MKILALLPAVPLPAASGAQIRNEGLLRLAAAEHVVDVLAFGRHSGQAEIARDLGLRRLDVRPLPGPRSLPRRALQAADPTWPDLAHRLWSPCFLALLLERLRSESYDVIQFEGLEMARYVWAAAREVHGLPARTIYDAHNAELLLQRRIFDEADRHPSLRGLARRAFARVQASRLAQFEQSVVRSSRATFAVSTHDANQLEALGRSSNRIPPVFVIPNGVNPARYARTSSSLPTDEPPGLLFLGKLDYYPNAQAIEWLFRRVVRPLLAEAPSLRVFVVGENPPPWLVRLGQSDPRFAITGAVADEVPYLHRVTVSLLPLSIGGGARVKALTAFAAGVPVVSTHLGMEGIDAEPGRDFLLAESSHDWVFAISRLLRNPALARDIAGNAQLLVAQHYSWSAIAPALRAAYASIAHPDPAVAQ